MREAAAKFGAVNWISRRPAPGPSRAPLETGTGRLSNIRPSNQTGGAGVRNAR